MPALDHRMLARALDSLYVAVSDEGQWATALTRLSQAFDSPRVAILRAAPRLDCIYEIRQLNHDVESQRLYNEYYWAFDPSHRITRNAPLGQWLDVPALFDPKTTPEPEYMDYAIRHGIRYVCGGKVHADASSVTVLGLQRPVDHRPFGEAAAHAFEALGVHIGRAVALSTELRNAELARSLSLTALDGLDGAVFAVDSERSLLLANRRGEAMLVASNPLALRGGKIASRDPVIDERIGHALRSAGQMRASAFSCESGRERWLVRVVPIAACAGVSLIYMNAAEARCCAGELLKSLFGFSSSEAEVAYLMADGLTAKEIARAREVSLNTVRSQAKRIFQKAGIRRQSELAKVLAAVPRLAENA